MKLKRFSLMGLLLLTMMLVVLLAGCEPVTPCPPTAAPPVITVECVWPTPEPEPTVTPVPTMTATPVATATPEAPLVPAVYDVDGQARSWAWLVDKYGEIQIDRFDGEIGIRLVAIHEQIGPASVVMRLYDQYHEPVSGRYAAFYWPDAPRHEDGCQTMAHRQFVYQASNADGHAGFGLGPGAWYDPTTGVGPHDVWWCSDYASDVVRGLGMVGGTNHAGPLSLDFEIVGVETRGAEFEAMGMRLCCDGEVVQGWVCPW